MGNQETPNRDANEAEDPHSGQGAFSDTLYAELRRLAQVSLNGQARSHTLQATALVNEAYLKLAGSQAGVPESRAHFFALAACAMRQILVDHARGKGRVKRGGGQHPVCLDSQIVTPDRPEIDVLELDEAIGRLAALDARQAQIVEMKFFGGLEMSEIAQELGISKRAAEADWTMAKVTLRKLLAKQ